MSTEAELDPEAVADLRRSVRDWLKKAQSAVMSFHNPQNNTFWRDSSKYRESIRSPVTWDEKYFSATTTARCYMAMVYADRCLRKSGNTKLPEWGKWFNGFVQWKEKPFQTKNGDVTTCGERDKPLNNFDVAHVADIWFVADYLKRFIPGESGNVPSANVDSMARKLLENFSPKSASGDDPVRIGGKIAFEKVKDEGWGGHHFFVTLHSLRAISIFGYELDFRAHGFNESVLLSEHVRQFCIEQCFFVERGVKHRQDIVGLAFALTIHCLYSQQVSDELCIAVVDALSVAQQENGSWPMAFPIFRGANRPWHITSHEIALCLTWLYFCPHLPDRARVKMLGMMERYFRKWVIPTFTELPKSQGADEQFRGWLDDHTMSSDFVVGWASAIVCHFLANYDYVLSNFLSRRVIESLGLQPSSSHYLIDTTAYAHSQRWTKTIEGVPREFGGKEPPAKTKSVVEQKVRRFVRATWFDLPPFAWSDKPNAVEIGKLIRWKWSDPSSSTPQSSDKLATRVLVPILESPGERPPEKLCSGILPGDPGTRKTSLVRTIGEVLNWPVVTVPASVIFEHGFDSMEARASEVFRRLSFLSGCIVFFDEFEEFFRDRGEHPKETGKAEASNTKASESNTAVGSTSVANEDDEYAPIHNRTIAAFTTPAMLPRLQELHDVGRCLIFFATNHPDKVDWAIKRPGRFDFKLEINYPERQRLLSYIASPTRRVYEDLGLDVDDSNFTVNSTQRSEFDAIANAVRIALEKENSKEIIKFADVEEALRKVAGRSRQLQGASNEKKKTSDSVKDDELEQVASASLEESVRRELQSKREPPEL